MDGEQEFGFLEQVFIQIWEQGSLFPIAFVGGSVHPETFVEDMVFNRFTFTFPFDVYSPIQEGILISKYRS